MSTNTPTTTKRNQCKNLVVYRNTSKAFELVFSKNCQPIDITGWTIYFTAKEKMEDPDSSAIIKKDITAHLDPERGKTLIELEPVDTNITPKSYYYDIKFVDDTGSSGILFTGRLLVREPVTTRG
ncbi:MAG: hypothetical protein R3321_04700 [Nitrososphaeraceae archaeon]|nr:hypothetical protein [Nitrososphaeraceae archaeon]